jgi:pimeloyl-ACP methyl ester carboxylesterase
LGFAPNVSVRHHQISSAANFPLVYEEYLPLQGSITADIVLVHGLASSGEQFVQEAIRFAEQGFRVIVPDLRGHGRSGVPKGGVTTAEFAIPVMARDVLDMLDHAGAQDVHWVGNSLGGILALWLLGTPARTRLKTLALFGTCFSMNLPAQVSLILRAAFLPGATATGWITARTTTGSATGQKAIETAIGQFNVAAGAAIAANVRHYDFVANARNYDRPLLVLWGGKDHAVNLGLRHDIGKFDDRPNFRRVDLPQGGHCANFDMPEAFCTALEQHWASARVEALAARSEETL